MDFEQHFTIPVPAEQAWAVLLDLERIAPCMPGATLDDVEGDEYRGKVKVKVGPMTVTYGGTARIVERDDDARTAVIEANGKETRGAGTARSRITGTVTDRGDEADVTVRTELAITGRPAQFGRGVMADVADKLLGQFADCLAGELAAERTAGGQEETGPAEVEPPAAATQESPPTAQGRREPVAGVIDLLDVAGAPVLRRVGPVLAVAAGAALLVWWVRQRT